MTCVRRRTSKRLTPPAHTGKPTRLRLPRLTILQHRPQALGRFSAWVCPTSPRVLKVAVRRFVQVGAPRCLPGSAVLSYERRRDGCRVLGLGEVVAQGLSSRRSRWPGRSAP